MIYPAPSLLLSVKTAKIPLVTAHFLSSLILSISRIYRQSFPSIFGINTF
ncbi:hypothetical protein CTRC342_04445 [Chlamydia trachomatis RC-F(s)/342]|nr:hypothetical protein G9768_04220 [Chlamydia trachomatis G/9768]ADH19448.1 hypothetical protein G11222_04250 [Chlamydia trachomatis G/11222]ADH20367.1 hypothetical protein G11074_04215 [Chlamydia trachomatis G/11074]ADH97465.1 hypothetical protein CTG9301_04230 [Chlamydia trachomatis G/9301]AGR96127.1 hypothetical protein CTRC852_04460 [Chlamydia trachomatis RC-F(s)/852]AGR99843.1 hypothetical protein CTRC342_04445 [Chlamydia trachomatis RC-F(s)/342]AHC17662.1 hypothetical protein CTW3_0446